MTNLRQAAQAVVDRWDTPAWEWRDQGPTADLMADLRKALAQPRKQTLPMKAADEFELRRLLAEERYTVRQLSRALREQVESPTFMGEPLITPPASQPEQQAEPVAYNKTELNRFVQDLYDQKMQDGKHGHYETVFHVVHQAIKKVAPPKQQAEPVAEKQQLQSELFQLAVSRGLITIRTERLDDRNVNTEVSWMQGHFVACDISNEAANNIKDGK